MTKTKDNLSSIDKFVTVSNRKKICNRCEYRHPTQNKCMQCGCPIEEMTADLSRTCALPPNQRKW